MKSIEIGGISSSYEAACQKMLFLGLRYLEDKPNFDWNSYRAYRGIYGVCIAESAESKALDEAICGGVDSTGAMHQAVISHLSYIHQHGHEAWLEEAQKHGREIIEVDEAQIEHTIEVANAAWQAELAAGRNPLAELLKDVPSENVVIINPENPESVKRAAERIARLIKGR